jgi:hypothetical protein
MATHELAHLYQLVDALNAIASLERSSEWRSSGVQNVFETAIQTPPER